MADDTISVELVAKIDQLIAGLNEAKSAVSSAMGSVASDVHGIAETSKESEGALESILSIEKFRLFAEAAKVALETVKGAFEDTVGKAEEFGLSAVKLAAMMGTNEEHAAGLSAALENVGSSTETYETIALRLEKSLRSTGGASAELKDQFKDSNGQFLTGVPLMERLKEVTDSYSEGAARTSVEQALLGRQTKAYYDISRVTADDVERQTQIYKDMGVSFADLKAKTFELEAAEGDLRTAWKAEQVVIGQELMPVAKEALTWLGTSGREYMKDLEIGVKALMTAFAALKTFVVEVVIGITGSLDMVWQSLKLGGNILADLTSGKYSDIAKDWEIGTKKIGDAWHQTGSAMKSELDDFDKTMSAMWDKQAEKAGVTSKQGGKAAPANLTSASDKGGKAGKEDRGPEDALKAAEKLALGEVAIEESKNTHLLAMGEESDAEYIAQKKYLADEEYNIKFAALQKELALPGRTNLELQKTNEEMIQLTQDYGAKTLQIEQESEKQKAGLAKERLTNAIASDNERLKEGMAELQTEVAAGQITAVQKAELEMGLTKTIRGEQIQRLNDAMALVSQDSKAYQEMVAQRTKLEKQFTAELKTESAQRTAALRAEITQGIAPIASGFKTAINDMMSGTKTWQQTLQDAFKNIAAGFIQMAEQMLEKWIVTEVTSATVTAASGAAKASTNTAVATTGAAASQASIPYVGPYLAAAAAASMLGLMIGYEALAHAEGGMVVDQNRLVFAHKEEMILPANLSRGVQSMIAGGGSGGGGGDINLSYAPVTHSASKDLMQLIREQPGVLVAHIKQLQRDGALR